ncbi:MAG: DUF938 domain-containing protein, partial [Aquisalimonadaceae bacterium]
MQRVKPWSQACENNREPILRVLRDYFTTPGTIIEIGSGTGQHAVYFAQHLPHLYWQPTDRQENLPGIAMWAEEADAANLLSPVCLDVTVQPWPVSRAAGVFAANTAHIMGWAGVEAMFAGAARILDEGGRFCLYGPSMIGGLHTSDSNARFDAMLRARDPASGIRDV